MVYGYKTDKEFIEKSYKLLGKLDKKHLWDKDTLVIGLDKSVRPLVYTLKKMSDLEKKKTPDIRFFNYSERRYYVTHPYSTVNSTLKERVNPEKLSKYKKILILDDISTTGLTLKKARNVLLHYFSDLGNIPKISLAALINSKENEDLKQTKRDFIFVDEVKRIGKQIEYTGIEDKNPDWLPGIDKDWPIHESIRVKDKEIYKEFLQNRKQLSEEIKKYVREKGMEEEKGNSLENKVHLLGIGGAFLCSLLFLSWGITGNTILNSSIKTSNIIGLFLFLVGIVATFFYLKKKRNKKN